MAEFPSVAGPMKVSTDLVSPTFANLLGFTTSDGRPRVSKPIFNEPVRSEAFGQTPEDYIYLGQIAIITMTLVKIDQAELTALMEAFPGVTAEGERGTVGQLWVRAAVENSFKLQLAPTNDPGTAENPTQIFEFQRVIIDPTVDYGEFGNAPTELDLSLVAIPDASGVIYTKVPT